MEAFHIWPITIYRYGIMYLIAFSVGYLFLYTITKKECIKQRPKLHDFLSNNLDELVIAIIIGGVIGWRIGEVLIYELPYYLAHPKQIRALRNGGMSFIGGMVGAMIGTYIIIIKKTWVRLNNINKREWERVIRLLDHIAVIAPFGIMLGRIGNFINKELFWIVVYNKALLSSIQNNARFTLKDQILLIRSDVYNILEKTKLIYDYDTSLQFSQEMRLNTNILASAWEWLLLLIILQSIYWTSYRKGKTKPGSIAFIFLLWYSVIRFLLEYLRQDSQWYMRWARTNSQRFFLFFMVVSIMFLLRPTKNNDWKK